MKKSCVFIVAVLKDWNEKCQQFATTGVTKVLSVFTVLIAFYKQLMKASTMLQIVMSSKEKQVKFGFRPPNIRVEKQVA